MRFIKVTGLKEGREYLAQELNDALSEGLRVGWLVSGGSNATLAAEIRSDLPTDKLSRLKVALVDERYGKIGHSDSNFTKLKEAGFDFSDIDFQPVLTNDNHDFEQATENYERRIVSLFKDSDLVIGQFGIGADGHTAGILPHSPATVSDKRLVIGYQGSDFKRITISFKVIGMVDVSYIFAFGEDKLEALRSLHDKNLALDDQPAQIFRQSGGKSFIINNMIGDRS